MAHTQQKLRQQNKDTQMREHKNLKLLCIKGHNEQSEKATYGTGKKISVNPVSDKYLI